MRRRMSLCKRVAFAAVVLPASLAAQSPAQTIPPPAPAPTPAPVGDSVGPPQLRDFNLNGTVTRPAPDTTPSPMPRAAPPRATPAPETAPVRTAPASRQPSAAASDSASSSGEETVALPPSTAVPYEIEPPSVSAPQPDPAPFVDAVAVTEPPDTAWWPWLAAFLAVALGAGFLWWRRQQRGGARYGADHDAVGAMVATPDAAPVPLPRTMPTSSHPAPRAPTPVPPLPRVAPVPDGIFASRLKPELAFELEPIRAEADAAEGAALTFDLIVINRGSAPARDVLIEAQLINAGPQVDAAVGRFFNQPGGAGERLAMIAPMSRVSIRTRLGAAAADLAPLVVEGRKLFVPVVAINASYCWSGGELKESSSFLVGRGETEGGKMAPFRLDRGARSWSGLAARLHSSGLAR